MRTLYQQIKELESRAGLIDEIRCFAKSDGGKLTAFGQNFVFVCAKGGIKQSIIAKILDVTASAISQQVTKINL